MQMAPLPLPSRHPNGIGFQHAIGGRLRLLKNGKINQTLAEMHHAEKRHVPGKRASVLNLSHEPRTALGYNADTLFLIVADGRQPKYSTGLTLYELAGILIETRCHRSD